MIILLLQCVTSSISVFSKNVRKTMSAEKILPNIADYRYRNEKTWMT